MVDSAVTSTGKHLYILTPTTVVITFPSMQDVLYTLSPIPSIVSASQIMIIPNTPLLSISGVAAGAKHGLTIYNLTGEDPLNPPSKPVGLVPPDALPRTAAFSITSAVEVVSITKVKEGLIATVDRVRERERGGWKGGKTARAQVLSGLSGRHGLTQHFASLLPSPPTPPRRN